GSLLILEERNQQDLLMMKLILVFRYMHLKAEDILIKL
mgnify:CR=1